MTSSTLFGDEVIDVECPPGADREPIFWTQADNGKMMLNFKYEGKWHRYALPKGAPYFLHVVRGDIKLTLRRLKPSERVHFDILVDGKAPKTAT